MPHPVIDAATRFRQGLLNREQSRATALVSAYGRAYRSMQSQITALEQQIAAMEKPEKTDVKRLAALRSLTAQVAEEVNRFATFADQTIANAVSEEIVNGLRESRITVESYFTSQQGRAAIRASWDMLPAETVETMLGFVDESSPLRQTLVGRLGEAVASRMADKLVDAITLGMNPRRTAALVRKELGVGLTWALTTARTAQLWAYREASRANYVANSNIVESWVWWATLDSDRTCLSCIAQHGSVHPVTDVLADHHSGRCVAIPQIRNAARFGLSQPEIESGEQWFRTQPASTQRQRMGPGMYKAWQANEFRFGELSQQYSDPVYGDMLREASLQGLLGARAQRYYAR